MSNRHYRKRFKGWAVVGDLLERRAHDEATLGWLNRSQRDSIRCVARMLQDNGVLIADEVGLGKTRIAVVVADAVLAASGRVAILVPPVLGNQWSKELWEGSPSVRHQNADERHRFGQVLRSLAGYAGQSAEAYENESSWLLERQLLMLSHSFTNWRLGRRSDPWRWAMLPLLYGEWRKRSGQRFPKGFSRFTDGFLKGDSCGIWCAAEKTAEILEKLPQSTEMRRRMKQIMEEVAWPEAIIRPELYDKRGSYRPLFEQAVGLGLGEFDLVIIDEAHKGRGEVSMLNALLNNVIVPSRQARYVGLTATPMELAPSDWYCTLKRLAIPSAQLEKIEKVARNYAIAARSVRQRWRSDERARLDYMQAAGEFQKTLSRYVLRRDKRDDEDVVRFRCETGESDDAYRHISEVRVGWNELSLDWRQAVCAAEALSQAAAGRFSGKNDATATLQRIRLTIGNGHGVASLVDSLLAGQGENSRELPHMTEEDGTSLPDDEDSETILLELQKASQTGDKRAERINWWMSLVQRLDTADVKAHTKGTQIYASLYSHPSILKAVETIEGYTAQGEKVLVFAKYKKPMHALTQLLNARAMIRSLEKGKGWPLSHIPSTENHDELPAVKAALLQLDSDWKLEDVNRQLKEQSRRTSPVERVAEGLKELKTSPGATSELDAGTLNKLHEVLGNIRQSEMSAHLGLAVESFLDFSSEPQPVDYVKGLQDVISTLDLPADPDDQDAQDEKFLGRLKSYLDEEYSTRRSTYAQMLDGHTKIDSRRIRQAAFNRRGIFPDVLIAQTSVAREGLNLHEACRVVVMLHPEWNPAVAEQQVGRVDRVNSHWARTFREWCKSSPRDQPAPRINIHHVIFEGTYDEHHWTVLNERWDDLRAQLHGVIVPQRDREGCNEDELRLIEALHKASPDFSPEPELGEMHASLAPAKAG